MSDLHLFLYDCIKLAEYVLYARYNKWYKSIIIEKSGEYGIVRYFHEIGENIFHLLCDKSISCGSSGLALVPSKLHWSKLSNNICRSREGLDIMLEPAI